MEIAETDIQRKIGRFALLGPIIISISLIIISRIIAGSYLLPLGAIAGVFISSYWQMRGVVFSALLLSVALGYHYLNLPSNDLLRYVLIASSLCLTFIVTALSYQQIEEILKQRDQKPVPQDNTNHFEKLKKELLLEQTRSKSLQQTAIANDAALKEQIQALESANSGSHQQIGLLEKQVEIAKMHLHECERQNKEQEFTLNRYQSSFEKIQAEIKSSQLEYEQISEELLRTRNDLTEAKSKISDTKPIENLKSEVHLLKNTLKQREDAMEDLQRQSNHQTGNLKAEIKQLESGLKISETTIEELKNQSFNAITEYQNNLLKKEEQLRILSSEKETLAIQMASTLIERDGINENLKETDWALRRSSGLYKQLCDQFVAKSVILDQTRHQLFHAEERLMQLEHISKEANLYTLSKEDRHFDRYICQLENERQSLIEEINAQNDLITFMSKL